nr:uncharacterized protein LOC109730785 [Microcebus murinus]
MSSPKQCGARRSRPRPLTVNGRRQPPPSFALDPGDTRAGRSSHKDTPQAAPGEAEPGEEEEEGEGGTAEIVLETAGSIAVPPPALLPPQAGKEFSGCGGRRPSPQVEPRPAANRPLFPCSRESASAAAQSWVPSAAPSPAGTRDVWRRDPAECGCVVLRLI